MISRGIRNNNPGNLDKSNSPWKGKIDNPAEPRFETFDTPVNGIRALAKVLLTYYRVHRLITVQSIITRWAPPSENDTNAYAKAVAKALGVSPHTVINVENPDTLRALVEAIIWHENGQQPYTRTVLAHGIESALA